MIGQYRRWQYCIVLYVRTLLSTCCDLYLKCSPMSKTCLSIPIVNLGWKSHNRYGVDSWRKLDYWLCSLEEEIKILVSLSVSVYLSFSLSISVSLSLSSLLSTLPSVAMMTCSLPGAPKTITLSSIKLIFLKYLLQWWKVNYIIFYILAF